MKKIILIATVLLSTLTAVAQTKVGTIDPELIVSKMPDLAGVQDGIKAYNTELETQLQAKVTDYETKIADYREKEATMLEAEKKLKQDAIIKLEQEIQQFQGNANQLIQLKQNELLNPLYVKIGEALNEIAAAEGFSQVLSIGSGNSVAYADPNYDLTDKVMAKLGIKVE